MSSNLLMPIDTAECKTCGKPIPFDKKYCDKECYYNRNKAKSEPETLEGQSESGEYTFVEGPEEPFPDIGVDKDIEDPFDEQLREEHIIIDEDDIDAEEYCAVCGARKILGRCVRFTQHPAPKKPKSR